MIFGDYTGEIKQTKIRIVISLTNISFSQITDFDIKVYNVYNEVEIKLNPTEEQSKNNEIDKLKYLYCGSDGFTFDITGGGSAAITEIHEAHLDILNRYTGFDVATNPATDITNWTALNTDKNWAIRYWLLKPTSLKSVLERLQYEGGFIFKWRADGSGAYWYIKDSYSSADATLLDTDIDDLEWGTYSGFSTTDKNGY